MLEEAAEEMAQGSGPFQYVMAEHMGQLIAKSPAGRLLNYAVAKQLFPKMKKEKETKQPQRFAISA